MTHHAELVLAVRLKRETPSDVCTMIAAMIEGLTVVMRPDYLARFDHSFFHTNWKYLLYPIVRRDPFVGEPFVHFTYLDKGVVEPRLTVRVHVPNGDDRADLFVDWLMPYCEPNGCAGYIAQSNGREVVAVRTIDIRARMAIAV